MRSIGWILAAGLCSLSSCAPTAHDSAKKQVRAAELASMIQERYPSVEKREAEALGTAAIEASANLRKEWKVSLRAWSHNTLVNAGFREFGLCYHWAQVLHRTLEPTLPKALRMTLVQSYAGVWYREHHAISLHARSEKWDGGILLDGWRNGGNLIFKPISESKAPWKYETDEPWLVNSLGEYTGSKPNSFLRSIFR